MDILLEVTKRLVEIDDDLLERARSSAGTSTIKATVEAGLRQLADDALIRRHIERLRRPRALDAAALEAARVPRSISGA
jgi:Arc/MetJ family transcription regulator